MIIWKMEIKRCTEFKILSAWNLKLSLKRVLFKLLKYIKYQLISNLRQIHVGLRYSHGVRF